MSSCPGLNLEDYVMWELDLRVVDLEDANWSIGLAEALGNRTRRKMLTQEQFSRVRQLYEPYREYVESRLRDFDEDTQSWRDYAGYSFDAIPSTVFDAANKMAQEM